LSSQRISALAFEEKRDGTFNNKQAVCPPQNGMVSYYVATLAVVEHNLELVKAADWVIDLGPEGGAAGGKLIAQGTPEQIAQAPGSYTGQSLREIL